MEGRIACGSVAHFTAIPPDTPATPTRSPNPGPPLRHCRTTAHFGWLSRLCPVACPAWAASHQLRRYNHGRCVLRFCVRRWPAPGRGSGRRRGSRWSRVVAHARARTTSHAHTPRPLPTHTRTHAHAMLLLLARAVCAWRDVLRCGRRCSGSHRRRRLGVRHPPLAFRAFQCSRARRAAARRGSNCRSSRRAPKCGAVP